MIYLDNGATTLHKPPAVKKAMLRAMDCCGNPGRGGYPAAMEAAKVLYDCREAASRLFHCSPEQVVLTGSCTHGLNMAIGTLVEPGDPVVISGFEHNAVRRPLHAVNARITVAGRRLFDWDDTLIQWEKALKKRPKAAIFTHCSNVFGYVLPVRELAGLCAAMAYPSFWTRPRPPGAFRWTCRNWELPSLPCRATRDFLAPWVPGCCFAAASRSLCCLAARAANPSARKCPRRCRSVQSRARPMFPAPPV